MSLTLTDRSSIQKTAKTVVVTLDFLSAQFVVNRDFFENLQDIMKQSSSGDRIVRTKDGQVFDLDTTGGLMGLSSYMRLIETFWNTVNKMADLGMKTENQLWSKLQN